MTVNTPDDVIFDLFSSDPIGEPKPTTTPEEDFLSRFCGGKMPKISNLVYWLRVQFAVYDRFAAYNHYVADASGIALKRVNTTKVARVLIEHYLMGHHATWFQAGEYGRTAADMDKIIDSLLEEETVKKVVHSDDRH